MEGQTESSQPAMRHFIILPILLTLITQNLKAENVKSFPPIVINKNLSISAVPILASTVAVIDNLKAINEIQAEEMSRAEMVTAKVEAVLVPSEVKTFKMSELSGEEKRKYVANFAESHTDWGFNYRYGGTTLETGIDCSGFTKYVLGYFDFKASRTSNEQYKDGEQIPVTAARPGDLVFFGSRKSISHVAVVVSNDEKGLFIVHSCNRGIVKENVYESSYWKGRLRDTAVNVIDSQK
jgi:cell wall-associated NlpC family hydrolase